MPRYPKPPEPPQDDDYNKILEKYQEIQRQIAHAEALITDEPTEIIDICSPEKDEIDSDGSNEGDTLMNLRFQALASGKSLFIFDLFVQGLSVCPCIGVHICSCSGVPI